jgi:hypothetical protein
MSIIADRVAYRSRARAGDYPADGSGEPMGREILGKLDVGAQSAPLRSSLWQRTRLPNCSATAPTL